MKRGALSLLLLASVAAADAPRPDAPRPKPEPASGPRIVVEPTSFDFGRTFQQRRLEKEFSVRNAGSEELTIAVSTTCGCTVAEGYAKTVRPGGRTPLRVRLDTLDSRGRIEKRVLIRSNDKTTPLVELRLEATVTAP